MSFSKKLFLGIDTSNYTTSAALCSEDGEIICNVKIPLPVKAGERGLRQSDAVFEHVKSMPHVMDAVRNVLFEHSPDGDYTVESVGCSAYPRDAEGSYMPCFLSGVAAAEAAALASGAPVYKFSHQRGHIAAALYSSDSLKLADQRFAAFHVSGGTTEILLVEPDEDMIIKIKEIGRTLDINAGQAIDRCGVAMGLRFPAGAELEKLALEYTGKIDKPRLSVNGLNCNLSGIENKAVQLYQKTHDKSAVAALVIDFVGRTLEALTENLLAEYGEMPVVYAGGVMSCSILKNRLARFGGRFAQPVFSSDNAAGIAWLAREKHLRETKRN